MAAHASRKRKQRKRRRKSSCRTTAKRRHKKKKSFKSSAHESRRRKSCAPKKHKKKKHKKKTTFPPARTLPNPKATVPVVPVQPVPPKPQPPTGPTVSTPLAKYSGAFGVAQAERLLWRAGFGPSPGHAQQLASAGLNGAVLSLTRPTGAPVLTGAAPVDSDGNPIAPADLWGHDHLWFLDRMVRTNQPLIERMTLIWHDWFANSNESVSDQQLMLDQNALFRSHALGSFAQLVHDITQNPAMIVFLNLNDNTRWNPNENYARELMELFTLGADRGAYTETDVRELARALTGWRSDWSSELGEHNFRFDATWHDTTSKTVFGHTGNYDWQDAGNMCVQHAMHPSFFVEKLWSYFIPTPPSTADRQKLESLYVSSGRQVRPIVEAILVHPALYTGPRMVKPPVVFCAGMLRALRRSIDTEAWTWECEGAGQQLFYPPNVAGWDDTKWLDTSTVRNRWLIVSEGVNGRQIQGPALDAYDATETPQQALSSALAFWGNPQLTNETKTVLTTFAANAVTPTMATWQQHQYRALRQNALRQLLFSSPDMQTS